MHLFDFFCVLMTLASFIEAVKRKGKEKKRGQNLSKLSSYGLQLHTY